MDDSLPITKLTWAVLLGRWTAFARSALALPTDDQGQRMRDSITDIITLQAICMSLQEIHTLDHDEQRLGLERARWLFERHRDLLLDRYQGVAMPMGLRQLIQEASELLEDAERDALDAGVIEQHIHPPIDNLDDVDLDDLS